MHWKCLMLRKNDPNNLGNNSLLLLVGAALLILIATSALPAFALDDCAAIKHNIAELEKYTSQIRQNISLISTGGSPYENPTYGNLLRVSESELERYRAASCSSSAEGG